MSQHRRVDKLEQRAHGDSGAVWVVGNRQWDWTPADYEAAIEEVRPQMGPDDHMVVIRYVKDWRNEQTTATN